MNTNMQCTKHNYNRCLRYGSLSIIVMLKQDIKIQQLLGSKVK